MMRELFDKYDCDKGWAHSYEKVYEKDFKKVKNDSINILELGIYEGKSLEVWLEYFPNATVYGIDIFDRLNPSSVPVLQNDRVKWIKGNMQTPDIHKKIKDNWGNVKFDFIIDDGEHIPNANQKTFKNFIEYLKDDGAYYIEDVFPMNIMTEEEMLFPWIRTKSHKLNKVLYNKLLEILDGYKKKEFDLRKSGRLDSYIIRIKK
jgi:hypothetical protein